LLFGSGIKKAIYLRGVDLNGQGVSQNMKGCDCAEGLRCNAKLLSQSLDRSINEDTQWFGWAIGCANNSFQIAKDFLAEGNKLLAEGNESLAEGNESLAEKCRSFAKQSLDNAKNALAFAKTVMNKLKSDTKDILSKYKELSGQFKEQMHHYSYPLAKGGFSGSLVVEKNDDGSYNAVGIYSGPLFTDGIKSFIKNAALHYKNTEETKRLNEKRQRLEMNTEETRRLETKEEMKRLKTKTMHLEMKRQRLEEEMKRLKTKTWRLEKEIEHSKTKKTWQCLKAKKQRLEKEMKRLKTKTMRLEEEMKRLKEEREQKKSARSLKNDLHPQEYGN
jgi:myosin heavy subunit